MKMKHKLKNKSSYTVVVLASLKHKACVRCNKPINSLEEAYQHWDDELSKGGDEE